MAARRLDGKAVAEVIKNELKVGVDQFRQRHGQVPGLATVLVGENPASQVYVRNKHKACAQVGILSFHHELPANTCQESLLHLVQELNEDVRVHGILIQSPLPEGLNEEQVMRAVHWTKDVDGFGPYNLGCLARGEPHFLACTPYGIWELLIRHQIPLAGRHVVIVGRSNIVGKPLALILMQKHPQANATVTVCHSQSTDLPGLTRQADVLVAAIGKAKFIRADMVQPGAVVVDVGINRLADGTLCGDVDFDGVAPMAGWLTPVPGGVGPMTIAMLLVNTLKAAHHQIKSKMGSRTDDPFPIQT